MSRGMTVTKGVAGKILDFLSTELRWFKLEPLMDLVSERYGVKPGTVQRTLYRLVDAGWVQRRMVPDERGEVAEFYSDVWSAGGS